MTRGLAVGLAILLGAYLLLTSTVKLHETLWPYDVKRFLELCLLALIFSVFLLNSPLRTGLQQQFRLIPVWVKAVLLVLFCLGVLSSVFNSHSTMSLLYSLTEVLLLSLLVLVVFCIAACRRITGNVFDQAAMLLIALVALTVGLQELLGVFAAWNSGLEFNPTIALLHFSYPRFYNQVQTWSIPAIAALPLVFPGKPLAKALCVAALALEWYVMLATGGRGSIVAVSLAILTAVLFLPGIRKTLILYPVAGFLGGLLIYGLVVIGQQNLPLDGLAASSESNRSLPAEKPLRYPAIAHAAIQAVDDSTRNFLEPLTGKRIWTFSGRLPLWRHSWIDAQSQPLLGIGPMNYACTGPLSRAAHPHNFLLQIMGEWGIPALLLLLLVLAYGWIRLLRELRRPETESKGVGPLAGFLAVAVLAASIHACLSGVLVMPASQVAGALICGWLLGLMPVSQSVRKAKYSTPVLLILGLSLSIALIAFTRHEFADAAIRLQQTPLLDRGIPRLWQNGKVCRLYREEAHGGATAR